LIVEEEKRRRLGHFWEASVDAKENLSVLMLACWRSLVVVGVFMLSPSYSFEELERLYLLCDKTKVCTCTSFLYICVCVCVKFPAIQYLSNCRFIFQLSLSS
jgi:hypothetical protein